MSRSVFVVVALAASLGACQAIKFGPVRSTKGTADLFCGYEPDHSTQMVVAVRTDEAVPDAIFIASPVPSDDQKGTQSTSTKREHVFLKAGVPNCIRLDLPVFTATSPRFIVHVSGRAGSSYVSGSLSACQPLRVVASDWNCQPR